MAGQVIYIIETIEEDNSTANRQSFDDELDLLSGVAHLMEAMEQLEEGQMICITKALF